MAVVDLIDKLPRADWSIGTSQKTGVTVHWNGTKVPDDVGDMDVIFGDAYYHMSPTWPGRPGGADGIMYHRLYGRDGTVYLTRKPSDKLWHCGNDYGNTTTEAWQVMSGVGQAGTPAQLEALRRDLRADGRPVFPHRYWSATQCPGDVLADIVATLKEKDLTDTEALAAVERALRAVLDDQSFTLADTIRAVKSRLSIDAHHTHTIGASEPVEK